MRLKVSLAAVLATALGAAALLLAGSPAAGVAATSCTAGSLALVHSGQLTVATDSPAYPPYFVNNAPANGKGFESAVAYAIAGQLGFKASQVKWTVEPFDDSYAPGSEVVRLRHQRDLDHPCAARRPSTSRPRTTATRRRSSSSPARSTQHVKSLAALKNAVFGVQVGTTSLQAVQSEIKPSKQPQVFNSSNDVVTALREHHVDAIVVDLATAFYLTSGEIPHGVVAGQFMAPGGDNWGMLLRRARS